MNFEARSWICHNPIVYAYGIQHSAVESTAWKRVDVTSEPIQTWSGVQSIAQISRLFFVQPWQQAPSKSRNYVVIINSSATTPIYSFVLKFKFASRMKANLWVSATKTSVLKFGSLEQNSEDSESEAKLVLWNIILTLDADNMIPNLLCQLRITNQLNEVVNCVNIWMDTFESANFLPNIRDVLQVSRISRIHASLFVPQREITSNGSNTAPFSLSTEKLDRPAVVNGRCSSRSLKQIPHL